LFVSGSNLFQTAKSGFTRWQYHYDNTTHKYTSHIHNAHKITPLKTNKQNIGKQISAQNYTNSEGYVTANEYGVEKGK
jgi:hypothetical protein